MNKSIKILMTAFTLVLVLTVGPEVRAEDQSMAEPASTLSICVWAPRLDLPCDGCFEVRKVGDHYQGSCGEEDLQLWLKAWPLETGKVRVKITEFYDNDAFWLIYLITSEGELTRLENGEVSGLMQGWRWGFWNGGFKILPWPYMVRITIEE